MIVTIDGPAGSGKSTAARGLAKRLDFYFLDTGAMYRAVAWACTNNGVDPQDAEAAARVARELTISFQDDRVMADGTDVTEAIRTANVSQIASVVAMIPDVREELVQQQRRVAQGLKIVTEGRDQGTVVFPDADCKFFVTAAAEKRAERRHLELLEKHEDLPLEEILEQIKARDARDETREVSPLVAAQDASRIDTSSLATEDVLDVLENAVRKKMAQQQGVN